MCSSDLGLSLGDMMKGFTESAEGQDVQGIQDIYQGITGNVATNDQLQQAKAALAQDPDVFNFIQKTFPQSQSDLGGDQYAANANTANDAGHGVWGKVSSSPISDVGRQLLDFIGAGEGGYDTARVNTGNGVKANYNYQSDGTDLSKLSDRKSTRLNSSH